MNQPDPTETTETARALPADWPPAVHDAFWTAVNAPTYDESALATLAFAQLLRPAAAPAPTVWVDGHPQLEAIAAAVWEKCRHDDSGSGIDDDPRNIAVAAYTGVNPAATAPSDPAADRRARYAQALHRCGVQLDDAGSLADLDDIQQVHVLAAAVMAVADAEQAELRQDVRRLGLMVDEYAAGARSLSEKLREAREDCSRSDEGARRALEQRQEMAEERYVLQEQRDRLRTELSSARTSLSLEVDWIIEHCPEHGCVEPETEVCHCLIAERLRRLAAVPAAEEQPENETPDVCICGHTEAQHFEDVCITEVTGCDCGDFLTGDAAREVIARWREAATRTANADDLPARLEAALTERFTELGNPFSRMVRNEKGPDGWPATHPVGPHHVAEVLRELLAPPAVVPQPEEADNPRTVCVCGHTRGEHITVSGCLLCDACDPDTTDNLICKEFEAL